MNIDQTIATYAIENRHRQHFQITTKEERLRLFSAIVAAIHDGGHGLAALTYSTADGRRLDTFLTAPEILHLTDVSRLIGIARPAGWIASGLWLIATAILGYRNSPLPRWRSLTVPIVGVITLAVAAVALIGPVKVFYQLHTWIFPADHPWFFFYQDSLMTTLLKAPDIFGPIVIVWLALTVVVFALLWRALSWFSRILH